jgi:hypothetical protein
MKKQIIKLNSHLIPKVKSARKMATTRLGIKSKYHVGPFVIEDASDSDKIYDFSLYICRIELIRFKEIDIDLANVEGYDYVDDFKAELVKIYGKIKESDFLTVIYFSS